MTGWVTRDHCGPWNPWQVDAYITANLLIWLAYMVVPIVAVAYMSKRAVPTLTKHVLASAAAFVFFCGLGHVVDGVGAFIWPRYDLILWWHILTAAVSWWFVIVLWLEYLKGRCHALK